MDTRYSITVIDIEKKRRFSFIKNLRILTGISLELSISIFEADKPILLFDGLKNDLALEIKKRLEEVGCSVQITNSNLTQEMLIYLPNHQIKERRYPFRWLFNLLKQRVGSK